MPNYTQPSATTSITSSGPVLANVTGNGRRWNRTAQSNKPNVGLMLYQRLKQWPSINSTLGGVCWEVSYLAVIRETGWRLHKAALLCKAKRQYLLTCKVIRYCLLALHAVLVPRLLGHRLTPDDRDGWANTRQSTLTCSLLIPSNKSPPVIRLHPHRTPMSTTVVFTWFYSHLCN